MKSFTWRVTDSISWETGNPRGAWNRILCEISHDDFATSVVHKEKTKQTNWKRVKPCMVQRRKLALWRQICWWARRRLISFTLSVNKNSMQTVSICCSTSKSCRRPVKTTTNKSLRGWNGKICRTLKWRTLTHERSETSWRLNFYLYSTRATQRS